VNRGLLNPAEAMHSRLGIDYPPSPFASLVSAGPCQFGLGAPLPTLLQQVTLLPRVPWLQLDGGGHPHRDYAPASEARLAEMTLFKFPLAACPKMVRTRASRLEGGSCVGPSTVTALVALAPPTHGFFRLIFAEQASKHIIADKLASRRVVLS
jgi:hypothetical protein